MTGLNWNRYQTVLICGQATRDRERVVPTNNYSVTSLYKARVLLRIIGFVSALSRPMVPLSKCSYSVRN